MNRLKIVYSAPTKKVTVESSPQWASILGWRRRQWVQCRCSIIWINAAQEYMAFFAQRKADMFLSVLSCLEFAKRSPHQRKIKFYNEHVGFHKNCKQKYKSVKHALHVEVCALFARQVQGMSCQQLPSTRISK